MATDRTYVFRMVLDDGQFATATAVAAQRTEALGTAGLEAAKSFKVHSEAASHAGEAVEGFSFKTAGAKRELLVLAHELSQGNYSRFGGSMLVLGERTGAAALLFSGLGIAALAATAVVGGFASQVIKGHLEQDHYNKSLLITGNAAGTTTASVTALSRAIAASSSATVIQAREVVTALASTGEVGSRLLGPLADAVTRVQQATGQSTEKIVADFSKIAEAPAKWAAEHNKAYNFITGDQYAYIKTLEEQGNKEAAALEVSRLLSAHYSGPLADSIYKTGSYTQQLSKAFGELVDWMRRLGAEESLERRLERINAQLENPLLSRLLQGGQGLLQGGVSGLGAAIGGLIGDSSSTLEAARLTTNMTLLRKEEEAVGQAEAARAKQAQVAAIDARDHWREETKGIALVNLELEKYRKLTVEPLRGTANAISAPEQAATEAAIRKRYAPAGRADPGAGLLESITAQRTQLALEQQQLELGGKIDKGQKFLAESGERLAAVNARLSASTRERIVGGLALFKAEDRKYQQDRIGKAVEDDVVKQSEVAHQLSLQATNDIDKFVDAQESSIALIKAQADLIGKSALEREQMAASEKLDQSYQAADRQLALLQQKAIVDGNNEALFALSAQRRELQDQTELIRGKLISAIDERAARETSAYAGTQVALARYRDDAANSSAFAQRVVGGGISRLEDSLTTFAETGKLKLGGLFKFMADEFIRNWVRMQIAQQTASTGGGGGLLGLISSVAGLFGAGGVNAGTVGGSNVTAGGQARVNFATGGDVQGGRAVVVGEHGPEIALFGHQGGRVLSNSQLQARSKSAGPGHVYVTNVGTNAQVSSAERDDEGNWHLMLEAAVQRGAERAHNMVASDLASGSGKASRALKSRGVGLSARLSKRG